jgi:hypothetical protein
MALKVVDLALYQGDDYGAWVNVFHPDQTVADLTGYTAQAQIRTAVADQQPAVTAEFTTAVVLPNQVSISLTHAQTVQFTGQNYRWDMQLTSAAGEIVTILAGKVMVTQEVTRE